MPAPAIYGLVSMLVDDQEQFKKLLKDQVGGKIDRANQAPLSSIPMACLVYTIIPQVLLMTSVLNKAPKEASEQSAP